ncbi:hypothetical protein SLT67_12420 [Paenibacillus illinoisensis]|uniref:hypothetical protein n=1 Tax=Paenibacillus illinoisensis TaxID=59845 RepID=UPI003CE6986F
MKKFVSLVITLTLVLSCSAITSASANVSEENNETSEISSLFTNFIDNAYENTEDLTVKDLSGSIVTDRFIEVTSGSYEAADYRTIQNLIIENNWFLSYREHTPLDNLNESGLQVNATSDIRGENVSERFYHIAKDSKDKFTKEWVVTLSGDFSYNTSTFKVTSVSGPKVSLTTANFGAMFSPALEDIYTYNSSSGSTATFNARYKMRAVLGLSIGDLPLGYNLDFGTHTDTMNAYPSVLQP